MERLNGWEAEVWWFLESLPPPSNTTGILGHAVVTFARLYLVFGVLYFEVESMHLVFGTTMIEGNTKMFDNTMVLSRGFVACVFGTGACIYYLGACIWYLELSI